MVIASKQEMNMDKIKFAQLVAFIVANSDHTAGEWFIIELDRMINDGMEQKPDEIEQVNTMNSDFVRDDVMDLMYNMSTNRKIEAIKAHRALTGMGLKE